MNHSSFHLPSSLTKKGTNKINITNNSTNYNPKPSNQRELSSRSITKNRNRSIDILNTSNISASRYTARNAYSPVMNHYTQYRNQSKNNTQSRIKKKIANMSKDFKEISSHGYINRPITSIANLECNINDFNINYISLNRIMNTHHTKKNLNIPITPNNHVKYNNNHHHHIPSSKGKIVFGTQGNTDKTDMYASAFKSNNKEPNMIKQLYALLEKN